MAVVSSGLIFLKKKVNVTNEGVLMYVCVYLLPSNGIIYKTLTKEPIFFVVVTTDSKKEEEDIR